MARRSRAPAGEVAARMAESLRVIDLCSEPASRVQGAAFYALKDLARGERVVLVVAQPPELMMQSVDLQLRHKLAWDCVEADGRWRIEVRHRDDVPPRDVVELLARDHLRLDGLLVRALQQLNRGEAAAAAPLLRAFAAALRRHMQAEDRLLARELTPGETAAAPLAAMLREHDEIRGQLEAVEACLGADAPEAGEIGAYCAILSGTLAKHEHREESGLFPLWRAALNDLPKPMREDLLARTRSALMV